MCVVEQCFVVWGECYVVCIVYEQCLVDLLFEVYDLCVDCGLVEVQLVFGVGEVVYVGDCNECMKQCGVERRVYLLLIWVNLIN